MLPKKGCRDRCLVPERRWTAALTNKPQLRAKRAIARAKRFAVGRKAVRIPSLLSARTVSAKKALMHPAVKDGPKDDEPAFLGLSRSIVKLLKHFCCGPCGLQEPIVVQSDDGRNHFRSYLTRLTPEVPLKPSFELITI